MTDDPRAPIDAALDTSGREGLVGTAPADVYRPPHDADQITIAPDWQPPETQPVWRKDFPIDWPQDNYVERRDFMKFMVLTSLAFTAGQFWIAAQNWLRRRRSQPPIIRVASVEDVPVGAARTFAYPAESSPCVLVRTGQRTFVAYGQKCTHLSCAVLPVAAEGVIRCPCHEGVFELASGRPIAGPPRRPLPLVRIEVRGTEVYATGIEERTS